MHLQGVYILIFYDLTNVLLEKSAVKNFSKMAREHM